MKPRFLACALVVLLPLVPQDLPIRSVPRVIDPHFGERVHLCAGAPVASVPRANDRKATVQAFLGPALRDIQVHQTGDSLTPFPKARDQLLALLAGRPQTFSPFPHWAEGTPLRIWGLLGTVRYSRHPSGRVELAGRHLCIADSLGVVWWIRLEAVDVYSDST